MLPPASRCTHKNVKRSGNQHGKYAVCQNPACGLKLRYDEDVGAWELGSLAGVLLTLATAVAASLGGTDPSGQGQGQSQDCGEPWLWDDPKGQACTTTARPSRRPQEFDMRSVASQQAVAAWKKTGTDYRTCRTFRRTRSSEERPA